MAGVKYCAVNMVRLLCIAALLFELTASAQLATSANRRKPYYVPNAISNLVHWWKADSYGLANETRLGGSGNEWVNQIAGSTYYGRQGTAANQPTFRTGVAAGLPGIFFTNNIAFTVQQYFDVSNGSSANKVILPTNCTIVAVCQSQGGGLDFIGGPIVGDGYTKGGVTDEQTGMIADNGTNNVTLGSLPNDVNAVLSVAYESEATTTTFYRNNAVQGSGSLQGSVFSFIALSANMGGVTTSHVRFGGYLYEIVIYDRALTLQERSVLQKYFARWGLW